MIDWGDEEKPRPHGGRIGLDAILKDARRGDLQAVRKHLRKDPTLLLARSSGHNRSFLWEAVRGNQITVAKYLLNAGADPNVPGRIRAEIVVLLKQDSSVLAAEQEEDSVWRVTPLHFAVAGGHAELVRQLIKAGAPVRPYTRLLCNAAVRMNHPEFLSLLLEAGADPQLAREWGRMQPGTGSKLTRPHR